jgi:hypothetical protein
MAHSDQTDEADAREFTPYGRHRDQLDMFGPPPERNYDPDPAQVRAELMAVLARARAAQEPWPAKEASYWRTVFPQMANWLPAEEADGLRKAFAAELRRLEGA